jgi:hypothetical protein
MGSDMLATFPFAYLAQPPAGQAGPTTSLSDMFDLVKVKSGYFKA